MPCVGPKRAAAPLVGSAGREIAATHFQPKERVCQDDGAFHVCVKFTLICEYWSTVLDAPQDSLCAKREDTKVIL